MKFNQSISRWRLCVAPMMDWTDRHCRYFHRQLTRHAVLYTEMVTTGALLHGDVARHLDFDPAEHPLALQLGGSEPGELARCARLGEAWGYDEINLNCGCPSERVQNGAFGACLMAEPELVADCIRAMRDAVSIPVTIKHRIGLEKNEDYGFVRDFVGTLAAAGCEVIFVPFAAGKPAGKPVDVLSGFVSENGDARGRPVGVAIDKRGGLLVADDVGNTVWRVTAAKASR